MVTWTVALSRAGSDTATVRAHSAGVPAPAETLLGDLRDLLTAIPRDLAQRTDANKQYKATATAHRADGTEILTGESETGTVPAEVMVFLSNVHAVLNYELGVGTSPLL